MLTNWVWYQDFKYQDISNKSDATNFLAHQIEINKLQDCINDSIRPCEITPKINDIKRSKPY